MKISVLDDRFDTVRSLPCFSKLAGHEVEIWTDHTKDADILAERLKNTAALVLMREKTPVTRALVERLPNLRMISQISAYPHIDLSACTEHGVLVSSNLQPGAPRFTTLHATAELTWALAMAAMRRIPQQMQSLKAGHWQESVGTNLRGRRLGVFGYGRIGKVVAGYGRAFGMQVWVHGTENTRRLAQEDGYETARTREEFFSLSDVLSLHLRLTDSTRGIVSRADLSYMKQTALIVNTSRAGLIERGALVAALRSGRPGMAALDVFDEEPLTDTANPLLNMDNVVATPHLGYVERDSMEDQFAEIFDQILAWDAGTPVHVANPDVLSSGVYLQKRSGVA